MKHLLSSCFHHVEMSSKWILLVYKAVNVSIDISKLFKVAHENELLVARIQSQSISMKSVSGLRS